MKINKLVTLGLAATLVLSGAYADDFDTDDFGSDTEDFTFGSEDFSFGDSGDSSSNAVEVSGDVSTDARVYLSENNESAASTESDDSNNNGIGDKEIDGGIDVDLNVNYSGSKADAEIKLNLNSDTLKDHPEDIIDEASVTAYLGNFKLEAGKMKNVWGKGDKLHVIDNFNADDYSDFIIPDYLDRRIAAPMVKGSYAFDYSGKLLSNMKIEGIYTPFLPVDRFATSGRWTPAQVSALTNTVTLGAENRLASAFSDYTTATTETGAILGALNTMSANAIAAKTALDTANSGLNQATEALNNVNLVHETVYKNLYDGAYSQTYSLYNNETIADAAAKTYAEANLEAYYENYMKTLNEAYDSTYDKDVEKANTAISTAKDAIAATTYDYQEAEGVYEAALAKYGYSDLESAEAALKAALTDKATKYMYALTMANALNADSSVIYPDTNTLKYGQAGARFTASLGAVDLGLSYYYGHYKQPSINYDKIDSYLDKYLANETITEADKFLAYDQKQTFGLEAATILWHFNLRGEACYNLTEDVEGTDPWVHNNSVQWLGGFDIDLPFWNMNVNVQETGTYILNNDKITGSENETFDVDYNKNGYTNNKVVANITTSFKNDQIAPEVTVMYGIENGDLVVLPKLSVKPTSELTLSASGMYCWCRDEYSEFAGWDNNNFVQLGASLSF